MTPQERAEAHWDCYVGPLQKTMLIQMVETCMAVSRFHYVTSHVHGVKHAEQDARETARAAFTPHSGGTEELLSTALRALCLTRDYVEPNVSLPAKEGWEWFDAGVKLSAAIPDDKWAKEFDRRRAAFTPVQEREFPFTFPPALKWMGKTETEYDEKLIEEVDEVVGAAGGGCRMVELFDVIQTAETAIRDLAEKTGLDPAESAKFMIGKNRIRGYYEPQG